MLLNIIINFTECNKTAGYSYHIILFTSISAMHDNHNYTTDISFCYSKRSGKDL